MTEVPSRDWRVGIERARQMKGLSDLDDLRRMLACHTPDIWDGFSAEQILAAWRLVAGDHFADPVRIAEDIIEWRNDGQIVATYVRRRSDPRDAVETLSSALPRLLERVTLIEEEIAALRGKA